MNAFNLQLPPLSVIGLMSAVMLTAVSVSADPLAEDMESSFAVGSSAVLLAQESFDDLFEANDEPEPTAQDIPDTAVEDTAAEAGSFDDLFETNDEPEATAQDDAEAAVEESTSEIDSFDGLFDEPAASSAEAAQASKPASLGYPISFGGFVQNELAYSYAGDEARYSKFLTRSKAQIKGRFSPRVSWQIGGHFQYNPVFEFENFYPNRVERDQKLDGWVDETFIDIDAGKWELRLGRQHIIWGEIVGLFVADVISALDLRQFILPDFDLIRIPQWAMRAEYFSGDFYGDIVYIPYMTKDDIGVFGSEFFPFPVTLPAGIETRFLDDKDPNDPLDDFGFGVRGSYLKNGWDVSLFYYTSPDKTAAFERELLLARAVPTVLFKPIHERIHQIGNTVSKEVGPFVVKAEGIQTMDRLMSVERLDHPTGLVETDELRYVIGADWAGFDGYNVNLQFFQTWFQDHDRDMFVDEVESGLSVLIRTTSWHAKVTPEILWIRSLNRDEWSLQAKVGWDFARNWRGTLGADIFGGPETGFFGRYAETDRVYYELRYSF